MDNATDTAFAMRAEMLVKEHIKGHRKGMPDMPNYEHSLRVAHLLNVYGFNEETRLAGLLHDIVEDGGVSFEMLENGGFSKDVVDIVRLCTHNMDIPHKDRRWILMVTNLAKADSAMAWAVKLADVFDNLMDAHTLPKEREMFMREVKVPVLLSASEHLLGETPLWKDLNHVSWSITKMIGEIGDIVRYVKHELETRFDLPDTVESILMAHCDEIEESNYGVANPALRQAIADFHDRAVGIAKNGEHPNPVLEVLANGLCGDMLLQWKTGNDIKARYRPS